MFGVTGTAEGPPKTKNAPSVHVFRFQQGWTNKGVPNTKNTPMWACFSCLVGRGGEGDERGGVGGNRKGEVGAGYQPNTKNANVFAFFAFGRWGRGREGQDSRQE